MMTMPLNSKSNQPEKIYEQKGPIYWNFEYLEISTAPCQRAYQAYFFPQVKLRYGPYNRSITFDTF